MDLLRDHYEGAVLDSWLEPEQTANEHCDDEFPWLSTKRIGYDADTWAIIEREPEVHWFG